MTTIKKRFRILIKIASIFLILLLLLVGAGLYVNIRSRPYLSQQIKENVFKATDSLYTISFTNLNTNFLTGNASLKNVEIKPNLKRYKELVVLKRAPNNLYQLQLKKLAIKRFHPLNIYRTKELDIDEIIFDKPQVAMFNQQFDFNENRPPRPIKSPFEIISKVLKRFSIGNIKFNNASFKYVDRNKAEPKIFKVNQINVSLIDFLIDSTSARDPKRTYLLKDVKVDVSDYSYPTLDSLYNIRLSNLSFAASTGELKIKKFNVEPRYSEMDFGKVAGYAKDRYDISLNDVLLDKLDLPQFIKSRTIWAKTMTMSNGHIAVFNNNSLPKKEKKKKESKFPQQLLQKLDIPLLIQQLKINDIDISYAEFDKDSNQKGVISFKNTNGKFKNVTNLKKIVAINPNMDVNLVTYLMGQGKLVVNFNFDLKSEKGAFKYNGLLTNVNARVLNQITKPLGLVRVNRGNIDELKFQFKADEDGSKGLVEFKYFDLSLALMENDPNKDKLVKRGLLSFLANALLINSENPAINGKFTKAPVTYNRPENSSFFNMLWRGIFLGVKHSVGITEDKEDEMRAHIAKFKEMKKSRDKRIERREERRKEREKR